MWVTKLSAVKSSTNTFISWGEKTHWMLHINHAQEPHINQDYHTECCTLTMHESHTLIKVYSYLTVFQIESSKSTWKSLHVSHNIDCSLICHKYIHIMGWKDQTSKEIATCGKFVSLSSCCEKAAAWMLRPFPVHFISFQSNSTQSNMHDSHADTENCMKYGFSYETDCWGNYCVERFY